MAKVTQPSRGPGALSRVCSMPLPSFSFLAETLGCLSQVLLPQLPSRPRGLSLLQKSGHESIEFIFSLIVF